jgi:hypothetical protein
LSAPGSRREYEMKIACRALSGSDRSTKTVSDRSPVSDMSPRMLFMKARHCAARTSGVRRRSAAAASTCSVDVITRTSHYESPPSSWAVQGASALPQRKEGRSSTSTARRTARRWRRRRSCRSPRGPSERRSPGPASPPSLRALLPSAAEPPRRREPHGGCSGSVVEQGRRLGGLGEERSAPPSTKR